MRTAAAALLVIATTCRAEQLGAQLPTAVAADRREYLAWLQHAPTSPFAAIALQRIGTGITLGPPGSDVELDGVVQCHIEPSGKSFIIRRPGETSAGVAINPGQLGSLGPYHFMVVGPVAHASVLVYGPVRDPVAPVYYPYAANAVDTVTLQPPSQRSSVLLLGAEGTEVDAQEAGTVQVTRYGAPVSLRVRRFPGDSPDETELQIYFRDGTSGAGSYPAGRFVTLEPIGGARYRLDMNRARNPFCAYSSVFPCPAPWAGNTLSGGVTAGERYAEKIPGKAEGTGR